MANIFVYSKQKVNYLGFYHYRNNNFLRYVRNAQFLYFLLKLNDLDLILITLKTI
jgi:hypothetical protein